MPEQNKSLTGTAIAQSIEQHLVELGQSFSIDDAELLGALRLIQCRHEFSMAEVWRRDTIAASIYDRMAEDRQRASRPNGEESSNG